MADIKIGKSSLQAADMEFKISGLSIGTYGLSDLYYDADTQNYFLQTIISGATSFASITNPTSLGVSVGSNEQGKFNFVTIDKAAATLAAGSLSGLSNKKIVLEDLKTIDNFKDDNFYYRLTLGSSFEDSVKFYAASSSVTSADSQGRYTLTIAKGGSAGVYVTGDGNTITYGASVASSMTTTRITGLQSGLSSAYILDNITIGGDSSIIIGNNLLSSATSKEVKITGDKYKLAIGNDVKPGGVYTEHFDNKGASTAFTYLSNETIEGSKAKDQTINIYEASKASDTLFTLSGLDSTTSVNDKGGISGIKVDTYKASGELYVTVGDSTVLGSASANKPTVLTLVDAEGNADYKLGMSASFNTSTTQNNYSITAGADGAVTAKLDDYYYLKDAAVLTHYASDTDKFTVAGLSAGTQLNKAQIVQTASLGADNQETVTYAITLYKNDLNKQNVSVTGGASFTNAEVIFIAGADVDTPASPTSLKIDGSAGNFTLTPAGGGGGYIFAGGSTVTYTGNAYGGETDKFVISGLSSDLNNFQITESGDIRTITATRGSKNVTVGTYKTVISQDGTSQYFVTLAADALASVDGQTVQLSTTNDETYELSIGTISTAATDIPVSLGYASVTGFAYTGGYSTAYFGKGESVTGNTKASYTYHAETKAITPQFSVTGTAASLKSVFSGLGASHYMSGANNVKGYISVTSAADSLGYYGVSLGTQIASKATLDGFTLNLVDKDTTDSLNYYFIDPDGDAESLHSGYARMDSSGKFSFLVPGSASGWLVEGGDSTAVKYQQSKGDLFTITGLSTGYNNYNFTLTDGSIVGASDTASITLGTYASLGNDSYAVQLVQDYINTSSSSVVLTRGEGSAYSNASIGFSIISKSGVTVADIGSQSKMEITFGKISSNGDLQASIGVADSVWAMTKNTGSVTEYTKGDGKKTQIFGLSGFYSGLYGYYDVSLNAEGMIIGSDNGATVKFGTLDKNTGKVTLEKEAFESLKSDQGFTLTDTVTGDLAYQLTLANGQASYGSGMTESTFKETGTGTGTYNFVNGGLSAGYLLNNTLESGATSGITKLNYEKESGGQSFVISGLKSGLTKDALVGSTTSLSENDLTYYVNEETDSKGNSYYVLKAGTYELTSNIALTKVLKINDNVVLNLNGYKISSNLSQGIQVTGNLTINDNKDSGTVSNTKDYAILVTSGNLTVNGGTITGNSYGIFNIGGNSIIVNDGTITASGSGDGIYQSAGNLIINGGNVTGKTNGINVNGGNVYVTDGTIGEGTSTGIYVEDASSAVSVNIAGGSIGGTSSIFVAKQDSAKGASTVYKVDVNIKGGTITGAIGSGDVATNTTIDISGGTINASKLGASTGASYSIVLDSQDTLYTAVTFSGLSTHLVQDIIAGYSGISSYFTATNESQFTVPTQAAAAAIFVGGPSSKTITINNAAIGDAKEISLTSNYYTSLVAGSDVSHIGSTSQPTSVIAGASWGNLSDGSITYTSTQYADYWNVKDGTNGTVLQRYSVDSGNVFTISGLYDVADNNPGLVKYNVDVTPTATISKGQYSITGYTFTAGASLLNSLAAGKSMSLSSDFTGNYSFSLASDVKQTPGGSAGASISLKTEGYTGTSAVYTYMASMTSGEYYSVVSNDHAIEHYAKVGGEAFDITGLSFTDTATVDSNDYIKFGGTSIAKVEIDRVNHTGNVILNADAFSGIGFGASAVITLTDSDMKDGVNYVLTIGAGMDSYTSIAGGEFIASASGLSGYSFNTGASGSYKIEKGITVYDQADTSKITYMGTNSFAGFHINGLNTVFGASSVYTLGVKDSVITATKTSGGAVTTLGSISGTIFYVYNAALSAQNVTLTSHTGSNYSLSLAKDVSQLDSLGTPSIYSTAQWVGTTSNDSALYTADKYSDYYSIQGASIANYYQATGGVSFSVTGLSGIGGYNETFLKNNIAVNASVSSAALNNGQYSVTAYDFQLGGDLLLSLQTDSAIQFTPNGGFSVGSVSLSYAPNIFVLDKYKSSINTLQDGTSYASITGEKGTYNYAASIANKNYYKIAGTSITHYAQKGGESFTISGLSAGLGALSVAGGSIFVVNDGALIGSVVASGKNDSISYVYLTADAFSGDNTTITLTDDKDDGVFYQLKLDSDSVKGTNSLLDDEEHASLKGTAASISFAGGSLTYTTAGKIEYGTLSIIESKGTSGITSITYTAGQSAHKAFSLSGIDTTNITHASLSTTGIITGTKDGQTVELGTVSGKTFKVDSTVILPNVTEKDTLIFQDIKGDKDIYQVQFGEAFSLNKIISGSAALAEDMTNKGTYTYTKSGAKAYTSLTGGESVIPSDGGSGVYEYIPAVNGAYVISGLSKGIPISDGMSFANNAVTFDGNAVSINSNDALPTGTPSTTIKIVGNIDSVKALTFGNDFATQSEQIRNNGSITSGTLTAPDYKPYYTTSGTSSAVVYRSYGGDTFTLIGWANNVGFQEGSTTIASGIKSGYTGTPVGNVKITPTSLGGASYVFTIDSIGAFGGDIRKDGTVVGIKADDLSSTDYELKISIDGFDTTASGTSAVLSYNSDLEEHTFKTTGRKAYFEPDSLTAHHEYTYRDSVGAATFTFEGLNPTIQGTGVSIASKLDKISDFYYTENWSQGSLGSVSFYLGKGALKSTMTDGASIRVTDVTTTATYTLGLSSNVGTLSSASVSATLIANAGTSSYSYTGFKQTAGYSVAADKQSIVYNTVRGGDTFTINGGFAGGLSVTYNGNAIYSLLGGTSTQVTLGSITSDSVKGTVSITSASAFTTLKDNDTISLVDGDGGALYRLVLADNVMNTVFSDASINSDSKKAWNYYAPAQNDYFEKTKEDQTTTTYTYHHKASLSAAFKITGLEKVSGLSIVEGNIVDSKGVTVGTIGTVTSGDNYVTLTSGLLNNFYQTYGGASITLTDTNPDDGVNYKLALGDGVQISSVTGGKTGGEFSETVGTYTFTTNGSTSGWKTTKQDTNYTTIEYQSVAGGRNQVIISGLATGMGLSFANGSASYTGYFMKSGTSIASIGWAGSTSVENASLYSAYVYDQAFALPSVASGDKLRVGFSVVGGAGNATLGTFGISYGGYSTVKPADSTPTIQTAVYNNSLSAAVYQMSSVKAYWDPNHSREKLPYYIYNQSIAASNQFSIAGFSGAYASSVTTAMVSKESDGRYKVSLPQTLAPNATTPYKKLQIANGEASAYFNKENLSVYTDPTLVPTLPASLWSAEGDGNYIYQDSLQSAYLFLDENRIKFTYHDQTAGTSFAIKGLSGTFSVNGDNILLGDNSSVTIGSFTTTTPKGGTSINKVLTLTDKSALGTIAAGSSRAITLTDGTTDTVNYSLSIANSFASIANKAPTVAASFVTLGGASYQFDSLHAGDYVQSGAANNFTYHAESAHDYFVIDGLKESLSNVTVIGGASATGNYTIKADEIAIASIGSMSVSLSTDAFTSGNQIIFKAYDGDKNGKYYNLVIPEARQSVMAGFHSVKAGEFEFYSKSGYTGGYSGVTQNTIIGGVSIATTTYTKQAGISAAFSVTGLNPALTSLTTTTGGAITANNKNIGTIKDDTLTLNSNALPTSLNSGMSIALTDKNSADGITYKLALTPNSQTNGIAQTFAEAEGNAKKTYTVSANKGLATISAGTTGYWSLQSNTATYEHFFNGGKLFTIDGLSTADSVGNINNYGITLVNSNGSLGGYNVSIDGGMLSRTDTGTVSIGGGIEKVATLTIGGIVVGEDKAERTGAGLSNDGVYSAGKIGEYLDSVSSSSYTYHKEKDTGIGFTLYFGGKTLDGKNTYMLDANKDIALTSNGSVLAHFDAKDNVVEIYNDGNQFSAGNTPIVSVTSTDYTKTVTLKLGTGTTGSLLAQATLRNDWEGTAAGGSATFIAQQAGYSAVADQYTGKDTSLVYNSNHNEFTFSGLSEGITSMSKDSIDVTNAGSAYTFDIKSGAILDDLAVGKSFTLSASDDTLKGVIKVDDTLVGDKYHTAAAAVSATISGDAVSGYTYSAAGTTDYFKGSGTSSILTHEAATGLEPFTISGLSGTLAVSGTSEVTITANSANAAVVGATSTDSIALVTLTEDAFKNASGSTIKLSDTTKDDIDYTLSIGTLATVKAIDASFSGTGTYTYQASGTTDGYGLSYVALENQVATHYAKVGGTSFAISGLTSGLGLSNIGDGKEINVSGSTVTLNKVDILAIEGSSAAFELTSTDGYSLSVGTEFNLSDSAPIFEAEFTGETGSYSFAAAHSGAYTKAGGSNSYTYYKATNAEQFSISGLSALGKLTLEGTDIKAGTDFVGSISGMEVTLNYNAFAAAHGTITFDGDTDGDGTSYTLKMPERGVIPKGYNATTEVGTFQYTAGGCSTAGYSLATGSASKGTYTWDKGALVAFQISGFSTTVDVSGVSALTNVGDSGAVTLKEEAFAGGVSKITLHDLDSGDGINYSLSLGALSLVDIINESFSGTGTYTYTAEGNTAGYSLAVESNITTSITHKDKVGGTTFTIGGLTSGLGLSNIGADKDINISGSAVTLNKVDILSIADGKATITFTDGGDGGNYALAFGTEYNKVDTKPDPKGKELNGQIYTEGGTSAYTIADGNNFVYNEAVSGTTIEFSGLSDAAKVDDITVTDTVITLDEVAIGKGTVSVLTPNYSMSLGSLSEATIAPDGFQGTAYKTEGTTEGYKLEGTSAISYVEAGGGSTLFEFTAGFAEGTNLTLDGSDIKDSSGKVGTYNGSKLTIDKDAVKVDVAGLSGKAMTFGGFVEIAGFDAKAQNVVGTPTDVTADSDNLVITTGESSAITIDGAAAKTVSMTADDKDYTASTFRLVDMTAPTAQRVSLLAGSGGTAYGLNASVAAFDASKASSTKVTLGASNATQGVEIIGAANGTNNIAGSKYDDTLKGGGINDLLKGGEGNDTFVQSAGTDTVSDYTSDEDILQLDGDITATSVSGSNALLTTETGTVVIKDGVEKEIKYKVGADGEEKTITVYGDRGIPTDAVVDGENLIVTTTKGVYTMEGAAADTVTLSSEGRDFAVNKFRITEFTDETAQRITLVAGSGGTAYGLNASVAAFDASKASSTKVTLGASNATQGVEVIGAANGTNNITGSKYDDTLKGGTQGDVLRGGTGNDTFVQSAGTDIISDYTSDEDILQLDGDITATSVSGSNALLTTEAGTIIIKDGVDKEIKYKVGADGEEKTITIRGDMGIPTDAVVDGENLIVTTTKGVYTMEGAAADTVTMSSAGRDFTVSKYRIVEVTEPTAQRITLVAGSGGAQYALNASVTAFDATKASSTKLTIGASKATVGVSIIGAANGANNIVGGIYDDTLKGGTQGDVLKGNTGKDTFIQSAGTDTISDYTSDEDILQLDGDITATSVSGSNALLTTEAGTIVIKDGVDKEIKYKVGADGEEKTITIRGDMGIPTDAVVDGENLIVTTTKGVYTMEGAAADTVTMSSAGRDFTVSKYRIVEVTEPTAQKVTLVAGSGGAQYALNASVTAFDATKASSTKLTIGASKATVGVSIIGAANGANNIVGGIYDDTLKGGTQGDVLKGNTGKDTFIQSAGTDTISDYTSDEDILQLESELTATSVSGSNVLLTTEAGTVVIKDGEGRAITYKVGADGEEKTITLYNDKGIPTDARVEGEDLIVTTTKGEFTFEGAASETVNMSSADRNFTVSKYRITEITDATAQKVTLVAGSTGTSFAVNANTVAFDATKAGSSKLLIGANKATVGVSITGAAEAPNTINGGGFDDTLKGGAQGDVLKGGAGKDVFVQSGGSDLLSDYTSGEDIIQLASDITSSWVNDDGDVHLSTEEGIVIIKAYEGKEITYRIGEDGELVTKKFTRGSGVPTDARVEGEDLVITTGNGEVTVPGAANDTINMTADGKNFTVSKYRITDVTEATAQKVTLVAGSAGTSFAVNANTVAFDATKAGSSKLLIGASKATVGVSVTGADKAPNTINGGGFDDTLKGGSGNDILKGGAGKDVFVQSASTDGVTDYEEGVDLIQLSSALTFTSVTESGDMNLTTEEGTIVIKGGADKTITYRIGEDGEKTALKCISSAPVDAIVDGDNLVVSMYNGNKVTLEGAANVTTTLSVGAKTFTVNQYRIVDVTDATAQKVTLVEGSTGASYAIGENIAAFNAAKVAGKDGKLTLGASKATQGVSIIGSDTAKNVITGGGFDDTLTGGAASDTLKGGAGKDVFVQSAGTDLISDYTAGDDIIELKSTPTKIEDSGNNVRFTTAEGAIVVKDGKGKEITWRIGAEGDESVYSSAAADIYAGNDDALWGTDDVKDTFVFDGGNDTIYNYGAEDEIALGGYSLTDLVNDAPSVSGNSVVFDFGGGNKLTIDGKAGEDISFSDGSTFISDGKKYSRK